MPRRILAGLVILIGLVGVTAADVHVTPVEIAEQRVVALVPRQTGPVPSLRLSLRVSGPEVARSKVSSWYLRGARKGT